VWRQSITYYSLLTDSEYLEVEVTLQMTVSGVGHPFGAHDQILLFPFFCRKIALLFVFGPLSDERMGL
jgi:hypothetical protein